MRKAIPFLAPSLAVLLMGLFAAHDAQAQQPRTPSQPRDGGKQTYKWVDKNGVTHYGDSVPAEYSQHETSVLNSQGVEVRKRLAEMSPAEAAAYQAKQKEDARRRQHDMFLLSTYPSVSEIEAVRDSRLRQINEQITAGEAYMATINTRVDGLKARALNFAPYNTKPNARRMPDDLAEEMVRAMSDARTQDRALASKRDELKKMQEQFEADIKRFKELNSAASARLKTVAPKS